MSEWWVRACVTGWLGGWVELKMKRWRLSTIRENLRFVGKEGMTCLYEVRTVGLKKRDRNSRR